MPRRSRERGGARSRHVDARDSVPDWSRFEPPKAPTRSCSADGAQPHAGANGNALEQLFHMSAAEAPSVARSPTCRPEGRLVISARIAYSRTGAPSRVDGLPAAREGSASVAPRAAATTITRAKTKVHDSKANATPMKPNCADADAIALGM
jgi:hypothetical protein